jgi:very-short-patch-repair endonuclease
MKISGHVDNTEAIQLHPVIGESVTTRRAESGIICLVTRIKGQKPLTEDEKCDIIRKYTDGVTLRQLCSEYHRTTGTIRTVIVTAGIAIKTRGYGDPRIQKSALAARGHEELTAEEKTEIARRYATGEVFEVLIPEFHRSKATIKKILDEYEIPIRRRGYATGTVWNMEWRNTHYQATHTDEFRRKSSNHLRKLLPSIRARVNDSPIEKMLHDELRRVRICFIPHTHFRRYIVDIEICQSPIIIEADGVMHRLSRNKNHDKKRDAYIMSQGCRIFRFTSGEIIQDAAGCIQRVITECELEPDICQIVV